MKSKLVILLFAFVSIYIMFNRQAYKHNMFQWDVSGYYLYLPAIFIYHDLAGLRFYPEVNKKYDLTGGADMYAQFDEPCGKRNNKYAVGTALFELPFFLLAHVFCLTTHTFPADGYSDPYQFAGNLSNIFWVCMGLLFISIFLRRYFSENITAFATLCIAFGTNIYCYTIFAPGMSHPYGFFLVAAMLYCTDAFYRQLQPRYVWWLGLLLGLAVITRPVNIIAAILPLLWDVYSLQTLRVRISLLAAKIKPLSIALFLFLLISSVQMAYWHYTTGHWIHYSYVGEGFNFLHPHIIDGLFSYQKGWFVYTPVAFICLLGLQAMWQRNRKAIPVIVIFFAVMLYVVFSWRGWWYGGSFSARAMIESLPVAAFPLAYLSQSIFGIARMLALKIAFGVVMSFFIALNIFQSYQYAGNVIHYVLMTKKYYWRVFGKIQATPEDTKYLMSWGDYYMENVEVESDQNKK